jgi:predicted DNA-binding protein
LPADYAKPPSLDWLVATLTALARFGLCRSGLRSCCKLGESRITLESNLGMAVHIYQRQIGTMLAIRLDPDTEKRRTLLARKTGLPHLEELEDIFLARERLRRPAKTYSAQEVKRDLGL